MERTLSWKNVKYYGWDKLVRSDEENIRLLKERKSIVNQVSEKENQIGSEPEKCDTVGKKSPVESQRETKGVRGRTTGSERNTGQNNAVTAGCGKALEGARSEGGEGAGAKEGFRRNLGAKAGRGQRPSNPPQEGGLGFVRTNLCEIPSSESPTSGKMKPQTQN